MWGRRGRDRRADRVAFRPTLGGGLESRALMTATQPHFGANVANGGRSVVVIDRDHERYRISVSDPGLRAQGATVRAIPLRNGRFDLVVYSSTPNTELIVDPIGHRRRRNDAHAFPVGTTLHDGLLHLNKITVKTGRIGEILAYRTADLAGQLAVDDTTPVDRIALFGVLPGATIRTGGDLNTLDVFNDATFAQGGQLQVGRDLNWFLIGNDLTIGNSGSITVGRDIGRITQGAKGTDTGGQGGSINGNFVRTGANQFTVGRDIVAPVRILGNVIVNGQVVATGPVSLT